MKKLKVGDKVRVERQPGFTAGGIDREEEITEITQQYDIKTGNPYKVIWCGASGFDSRTGYPTTPPWAYQIVL